MIKFQDSLNLLKIKEQNICNPIETKIIDIDWTFSVTDSGYLIQIQDIDEIHKVFNDLKESNANFQTVFDIAPIVLWKPEGLPAQIAASTGKPYSKLNLI